MSRRAFDDPHGTSDEARQALLDNQCEAKPKRHRTNKRRSKLAEKKRSKARHKAALNLRNYRKYRDEVSAYFRGERDEHP